MCQLCDELPEKSDLKLGNLSIVMLLDTTKWICGTLSTYIMCRYFVFFLVLLMSLITLQDSV